MPSSDLNTTREAPLGVMTTTFRASMSACTASAYVNREIGAPICKRMLYATTRQSARDAEESTSDANVVAPHREYSRFGVRFG